MGRDREVALSMILPRAMGALRSHGLPYFDWRKTVYLQAQSCGFRIWARPKPHFVYLKIGYRHVYSVLHIRIFSDGSGDFLDDRVSVIGWDRGHYLRRWQSELFDTFSGDDDWFLSVDKDTFVPNVVKSVRNKFRIFNIVSNAEPNNQ